MSTKFHRMTLRIPVELREWLDKQAGAKHRSVTAEIVNMVRTEKEKSESKQAA